MKIFYNIVLKEIFVRFYNSAVAFLAGKLRIIKRKLIAENMLNLILDTVCAKTIFLYIFCFNTTPD